ncbi:hypothetical protein [Flagellimonas pacifica]|nr:hypothetical protein [Allomuricauda parva]
MGAFAQDKAHTKHGLRFYEQLAQRDADYEKSLQLLTHQDESDYWIDQGNFERQLGKSDFASYLAYMKGKKDAYNGHLKTCDHKVPHSELYLQKAKEYLSLTDLEFTMMKDSQKVVRSSIKKKRQ